MHQPEYNDFVNDPQKKALDEWFDQEEKRLGDLRKEFGDDHIMRMFRPKKKDYLKPPKK